MPHTFDIIVDTREQQPLEFNSDCIGHIHNQKLDTGDYSIMGLEDVLFIERKASVIEFYGNISQKRFWNELDRTPGFKYKYMIMQFDAELINMFPYNSNLPKRVWSKLKITPQYLFSCLSKIQVDYGINVMFTGNREVASVMVTNIMKRVYAIENK
jgi:ERCC4-type nuclease